MIAVYNIFNTERTISESLLSVLPHVEKVIAVDGAYKRFPHKNKNGASSDSTKRIFRRLCGSKLVWVNCRKPMSQVAKKNIVLKHVPNGKWFLRLAGDEVIKPRSHHFGIGVWRHSRGNVGEELRKAVRLAELGNFTNIGISIKNFSPVWKGYKVRKIAGHAYVDLAPPIPKRRWNSLKWRENFGIGNRLVRKQRGLHFKGHHSTMFVRDKLMAVQMMLTNVLIINMHHKVGWERWHQKIEYKRKRYEAGDFEG